MTCFKSDKDSCKKAADFLKEGKVVILPTDTVYGFSSIASIGAGGVSAECVDGSGEEIRRIKGREEGKKFIVLVSSVEEAAKLTPQKIPSKLLEYWPGPLTIILETFDGDTVAVRCPGDEWLRNVIKLTGSPIFSTSVNRSGSPVLTKQSEIIEEFEKEVSLIVLNGDSVSSVPSTIVKVEGDSYTVVRKGAVNL